MIGDDCPRDILKRLKTYRKSLLDLNLVKKTGEHIRNAYNCKLNVLRNHFSCAGEPAIRKPDLKFSLSPFAGRDIGERLDFFEVNSIHLFSCKETAYGEDHEMNRESQGLVDRLWRMGDIEQKVKRDNAPSFQSLLNSFIFQALWNILSPNLF